MCQIHLLFKLGNSKLNNKDLEEFNRLMCYGSLHNSDAWGVFNDKSMVKNSGKFNKLKLDKKDYTNSNFIVGHNRLATMGEGEYLPEIAMLNPMSYFSTAKKKKENHHPFIKGDLTLVHNGFIGNASKLRREYGIKSKIKTDSYVILFLIDYYLNKMMSSGNRKESIVKAIQKTTKQISGSYSVLLYDKKTKSLFYFKNFQTDFNFNITNDVLIGSTNYSNLDYVYFEKAKKDRWICDNNIYLINKTNILKVLGKFKEKPLFSKSEKSKIDKFLTELIGYIPHYRLDDWGMYIILKKQKGIIKKLVDDGQDYIKGKKYIKIPIENILERGGWFKWLFALVV